MIYTFKDDDIIKNINNTYEEVDLFYKRLYELDNFDNKEIKRVYSVGQHNFSLDIMKAIRDNKILLAQVGAGLGRKRGYLIPIFNTYKNEVRFNKVLIATTDYSLQKDLLRSVHKTSDLLGVYMKAVVLRDGTNYACLKRLDKALLKKNDPLVQNTLIDLKNKIMYRKVSLKEELFNVSKEIWNEIKLINSGTCSNCNYNLSCNFYKNFNSVEDSNIIISDHRLIFDRKLMSDEVLSKFDMIVIDEAYKLKEVMRSANIQSLTKEEVLDVFNQLISNIDMFFLDTLFLKRELVAIKEVFIKVFEILLKNASYDKNRKEVICYNEELRNYLEFLKCGLSKISNNISSDGDLNYQCYVKINKFYDVVLDISLEDNSKNFYWLSLLKNKSIKIFYTLKNYSKDIKYLFERDIPVLFTSEVMLDSINTYNYFYDNLNLDCFNHEKIIFGEKRDSCYDYSNNTLFYYNPNISLTTNYNNYVENLVIEIEKLLQITKGKTLILFPTLKRMNDVLKKINKDKFNFELLVLRDRDRENTYYKFMKDIDSCLFACNIEIDSLDLKGSTLSNIIITRLPFQHLDIIEERNKSIDEIDNLLYRRQIKESMLIYLKQIMFKVIRTESDMGIISCLDSRIVNYLKDLYNSTPFMNFTSDILEVADYSENKILNQSNSSMKKIIKK